MVVSFIIGIILGLFYFGGLYYTTQKLKNNKSPGSLMIISTVVRMAIIIFGLYYLAKRGINHILIGSFAIILVRIILVIYVKKEISEFKEGVWFFENRS